MNGRPKKYLRFRSLETLDLGGLTGIIVNRVGSGTLQMSGMFVLHLPPAPTFTFAAVYTLRVYLAPCLR